MPRSKNDKLYYTKAQYKRAKYDSSALEYAQSQGYDLVKKGSYYYLREHDSMVFTRNGRWYWNSRGVHGGAIEFQMYYEGKTLTEAVLTLAGDMECGYRPAPRAAPAPPEPPKEFALPERSRDFRQLFGYLCQTRGLDKAVVMEMLQQKVLYEGINRKNGIEFHNAVFVRYDSEGKPVGAFQRGLNTKVSFRGDVEGSSKKYGWLLKGDPGADCVCVFEAAIDAASHLCLTGNRAADRLSLDGVTREDKNPESLENYLALNPQVRSVMLMLDADEAGQRAAASIQRDLTARGYAALIVPPPYGKDYNDTLRYTRAKGRETQPFAERVDQEITL